MLIINLMLEVVHLTCYSVATFACWDDHAAIAYVYACMATASAIHASALFADLHLLRKQKSATAQVKESDQSHFKM